jgi:predicted phosphodiesterase
VVSQADVVVLAGDIHTGLKGLEWINAHFASVPVVYVAGNHEFYSSRHKHASLIEKLRRQTQDSNIFFLENATVFIGGVRFIGATLWTDFALHGAEQRTPAMHEAAQSMNDYARIRLGAEYRYRKLRPLDTARMHTESLAWIKAELDRPFEGKTVVVTHHAPSILSIDPRFRDDPLSACYASVIDKAVMNPEKVSLWLHGHTHYCGEYVINGVRVASNQRGYYPDELVPGFREDCLLSLECSSARRARESGLPDSGNRRHFGNPTP